MTEPRDDYFEGVLGAIRTSRPMTDPVPLTAEEEKTLREAFADGMRRDRTATVVFAREDIARLLATLDRDRSTPSVDGLREALAVYNDPAIAMNTSAATLARAVRTFLDAHPHPGTLTSGLVKRV